MLPTLFPHYFTFSSSFTYRFFKSRGWIYCFNNQNIFYCCHNIFGIKHWNSFVFTFTMCLFDSFFWIARPRSLCFCPDSWLSLSWESVPNSLFAAACWPPQLEFRHFFTPLIPPHPDHAALFSGGCRGQPLCAWQHIISWWGIYFSAFQRLGAECEDASSSIGTSLQNTTQLFSQDGRGWETLTGLYYRHILPITSWRSHLKFLSVGIRFQ